MVLDPVAYFSPAILLRMFLDFPFSSQPVSARVPPGNLNFKGMVALPLTLYPSMKLQSGQHYAARERTTARGRVEMLVKGSIGIEP